MKWSYHYWLFFYFLFLSFEECLNNSCFSPSPALSLAEPISLPLRREGRHAAKGQNGWALVWVTRTLHPGTAPFPRSAQTQRCQRGNCKTETNQTIGISVINQRTGKQGKEMWATVSAANVPSPWAMGRTGEGATKSSTPPAYGGAESQSLLCEGFLETQEGSKFLRCLKVAR